MNNNNFDNLGFIFKSSKIILKHDEESDYFNKKPEPIGFELCNFTDKNRVSVFKLTKENFIASSIDISTSKHESWEILKDKITLLINKPFVISLSVNGNYNSFYSKLINAKTCDCCEDLFLYFKFNFIANLFNPIMNNCICDNISENKFSVTSLANLTYHLEEGTYQNVKFYFNSNDTRI
jgi:hypothetical protein